MNFERFPTLLAAFAFLLLAAPLTPQAANLFPTQPDGARVFTIGNSHTASSLNVGLEDLAWGNGHPDHFHNEAANIPGASLKLILENSPNLGPLETESWDIVTLQTYNNTSQDEIDAAIEMARRARIGNPNARIILYTIWPKYEERNNPPLGVSEAWTETVAAAIVSEYPDMVVQVAPTSSIIRELYERIDAGEVPNIPAPSFLFRDGGHLGNYGAYAVNLAFACMIYDEPPWDYPLIGVNKPPADIQYVEPETAAVIKQVVWDILQTYPAALINDQPTVATRRLDPAVEGLDYDFQLAAVNQSGNETWEVISGALPSGLALSLTGAITGVPQSVGASTFTVRMTDGTSISEREFRLQVAEDLPPTITTTSLPSRQAGLFFSQQLEAADGVGAIGWEITGGSLPPGLSLIPYGFITGAPGQAGTFPVTITATDSHPNGAQSASVSFDFVITAAAPGTYFARQYEEVIGPIVDGLFEEPFWNFDQTLETDVEGSPTATAVWDAYWIDETLVIGVQIQDGALGQTPLDAVEIFIDGNNNDEIIYNYDDAHWQFQRDGAGGNNKIVSGFMAHHSANFTVVETGTGWNVEIALKRPALRGRGITTAWPDWAVYGIDIGLRQGTSNVDRHRRVWMGTAENPTDTSGFGTFIFDGEASDPNYSPELVNGDFSRDRLHNVRDLASHALPKQIWVTPRNYTRPPDSSPVLQLAWNIIADAGIFQDNAESTGLGLMQIIDTPPAGDATLRFEYQAPTSGFALGVWGATIDEAASSDAVEVDTLIPPNGAPWLHGTQFLHPQTIPPTGDNTWRVVSFPVNIVAGPETLFLAFRSDAAGDTGIGIRNVTLETSSGVPPEGVDDSLVVLAGMITNLPVLDNDLANGSPLAIASFTQPEHGTLAEDNGLLRYTPHPAYQEGSDAFTYLPANTTGPALSSAVVTLQVVNEYSQYNGDGDELPDGWELTYYTNLEETGVGDYDGDGIADGTEFSQNRLAAGRDERPIIFEDYFDDRGPGLLTATPAKWSVPGGGLAEIAEGSGTGGSQALRITTGSTEAAKILQYYISGYQPTVWTDFHGQLAPYPDDAAEPDVDPETLSAFHLVDTGAVKVLDGANWRTYPLGLDTGVPHRFTVRQDFVTRTWELWVDGQTLSNPAPQFDFNSATTRQTPYAFVIEQGPGQTSVIDAIRVWKSAQEGLAGVGYYTDWASGIAWDGSDSSASGDPNRNALSNLLEYGFHLADPVEGTENYHPGFHLETANTMTYQYRRNRLAEDVEFTIERSTTLIEWSEVRLLPTQVTVTPLDAETDLITVALPRTEEAEFLRLQLQLRAP